MLTSLRIQNLALVEDMVLEMGSGFTVLTGETGAGKSLLVDALSLLVGSRGDSDTVRRGEDRAIVEGTVEINIDDWKVFCESKKIPLSSPLLIRREVAASGRSRVSINGIASSVGDLKEAGKLWMRLMSQHDHQSLLDEERHLGLLDEILGIEPKLSELVERVRQDAMALRVRRQSDASRAARLMTLVEDMEKLKALEPLTGEWSRLKEEREPLRHATQLDTLFRDINNAFDESTMPLDTIRRSWSRALLLWPEGSDDHDRLRLILSDLEDMKERSSAWGHHWNNAGLEKIEALESRLAQYEKLARHHHCEPDELESICNQLREEKTILESSDGTLDRYETALKESCDRYARAAQALHEKRSKALPKLERDVHGRLERLGMRQARMQFRLAHQVDPESPCVWEKQQLRVHNLGWSDLSIWIESNTGEGFRPLAKIASGGELSRVMLALLGAGLHPQGAAAIPITLVLDEVDAGVGGETAIRVGESMKELSQAHQVLAVTHLAQVASKASSHWRLTKETVKGRTRSLSSLLQGEIRIHEVARLLSGDSNNKETLDLARNLLRVQP